MVARREVDCFFLDDGGEDVADLSGVAPRWEPAGIVAGGCEFGSGSKLVAGWQVDCVWRSVFGGEERDSRGGREGEGSEGAARVGAVGFATVVAGREVVCGDSIGFAGFDAV